MHKASIIVFLVIAPWGVSVADDMDCIVDLPIDTPEEAWCIARERLMLSSCIGDPSYRYEATEERDATWVVSIYDLHPVPGKGCRNEVLTICKATGKVLQNGESCAL